MPEFLNNLGCAFQSSFRHTGDLSHLSEAISAQQRAVQLSPNGQPDLLPWLNNLGNSFQSCFVRTGDLSDISEAISAHQHAVQLTPDTHPDFPIILNNLGVSFQRRFARMGGLGPHRSHFSPTSRRSAHFQRPSSHAFMAEQSRRRLSGHL